MILDDIAFLDMKNLIWLLILLSGYSIASAQVLPGGAKTVYEDKHEKSRRSEDSFYFIEIGSKLCSFKNDNALELGLEAGGSIGYNFFAAFNFYSMFSSITYGYQGNGYAMRMSYGGLKFGYIIKPFQGLELDIAASANIAYADFNPAKDFEVYGTNTNDWFFVVEPSASASVRASDNLLLGVSGAYRQAAGFEFSGLDGSEFNGFIPGLFLKVYF